MIENKHEEKPKWPVLLFLIPKSVFGSQTIFNAPLTRPKQIHLGYVKYS